jgi:hypothetical protein
MAVGFISGFFSCETLRSRQMLHAPKHTRAFELSSHIQQVDPDIYTTVTHT